MCPVGLATVGVRSGCRNGAIIVRAVVLAHFAGRRRILQPYQSASGAANELIHLLPAVITVGSLEEFGGATLSATRAALSASRTLIAMMDAADSL